MKVNTSRRHSLSTKLLIAIVLWIVCALSFTGLTLAFLWQLENGGIAINNAGSLRMRVYHIVTLLNEKEINKEQLTQERTNFTTVLNNLKKTAQNSFFVPKNDQIKSQIDFIQTSWKKEIVPLFKLVENNKKPSINLIKIDSFVNSIDTLVKMIETQNTQHISWLRLIQSILIIMVIFSAFTSIYLLYRLVISPLSKLQEGINQIRDGNLTERIIITNKDEFGIVSAGFNKMAENLADLYNNLEKKVAEKTIALEEKNHELSALYDVTAFLHEFHTQEIMTESFLNTIIKISHADSGSIQLLDETQSRLNYVASHSLPEELIAAPQCSSLTDCFCGSITNQGNADTQFITITKKEPIIAHCIKNYVDHFIIFHIAHNNRDIGIMKLYFNKTENKLQEQTIHLIETLTDQLAVALENQQLALSDKQLAVMKERSLIAQGLHDSIAQSLSFLNLQIQMLQTAIHNNEQDQIEKTLTFIQQGIQESYEDVRELLLNFRTKFSKEGFREVVQKLLSRFEQQTKVHTEFVKLGHGPSLNPQQQLQVIFILQEALSNIRKHAKCNHVKIHFNNEEQFVMTISDDGCGFNKETIERKKARHVGLSIMTERAAQISSTINITSELNKGTTITLTIPKEQRGIL